MQQRLQRRTKSETKKETRTKAEKKSYLYFQRKRATRATHMPKEKDPQELLRRREKKSNNIYPDTLRQRATVCVSLLQ